MEILRNHPGRSVDRLGVEAELEHVSRLRLGTSELGVDRLVAAGPLALDLDDEVGDPPHTLVDERELVEHIVALAQQARAALGPCSEGLPIDLRRHFDDREAVNSVLLETGLFVDETLVDQQLSERAEPGAI